MKKKIEKVALYSAEEFFSGKKDLERVGWCSNPDKPGPMILDRRTFERICGVNQSVSRSGRSGEKD